MIDWNIQSRSHTCQACGKAFADKEAYHTLLFDRKPGYERLDVCEACWKNQYSQGGTDRKGFVSYWQGVYSVPPPPPPEPIQKETAETLFRKLIERNDPQYAAAGYILSAMLERKRILRVKAQTRREGKRIFIYEHPKSGDVFTIPDPDLQLNQLEAVQRQVAQLLEHGLPPSAGESETLSADSQSDTPGSDTDTDTDTDGNANANADTGTDTESSTPDDTDASHETQNPSSSPLTQ